VEHLFCFDESLLAIVTQPTTQRRYSMNKGEFIEKLAKKAGLTKKDANKATDAMLDLITGALAKNDKVLLTGFGKFEARTRKSSKRINPQTGKKITVPAKVVPVFKAGKILKTTVAKKAKRR